MLSLLLVLACTPKLTPDVDTGGLGPTGVVETADSSPLDDTAGDTACLLYRDEDGDGWGDEGQATTACDASGYVAQAGDCDDRDANIHPEGIEVCNGLDDDCDLEIDEGDVAPATWYEDLDGDGYGTSEATQQGCEQPEGFARSGDDCDDTDADVHPYADESCDGLDEDCDLEIDEGVETTFFADLDGDGYGDPDATTLACSVPSGHVADDSDCDDSDSGVHPTAAETCDGVDEDCDGTVDDDPTDPTTWYADSDGDGHGDATTTTEACDLPSGYDASSDDCDDSDGTVHPGATETCDDVDEDCDGSIDEDAVDRSTWYLDSDGDAYGDAGTTSLACDQPASYVADAKDCDDSDSTIHPGAEESCDGVDEDCDKVVDNDPVDPLTWTQDKDGDDHGAIGGGTTEACDQPTHYAASADDCDDGDAAVNPSATEVCDSVDNDCDGRVDEGVETTWYQDDDGDGQGRAGVSTTACSAPSGYVSNADDCYDSNADAYLGQTAYFEDERGDGSWDYDCDGSETEEYADLSSCEESGDGCSGNDGWYYSDWYGYGVPDCGDAWYWQTDCELEDWHGWEYCELSDYETRTQPCR